MGESINSDLIVRHYNFTGKINKREHDPGTKALLVVVIIVCCFIILENVLVLLTIWKTKKFHTPMYYFIGNLAMSDLLAGVVYTANILLSGDKTLKLTPTAWFFREGSMFVALSASVFSLLAIAIERHLTMLKNKLYVDKKTWRVFLLIGTCWLIAAIQGVLPIMGWNCIDKIESCSTLLPLYQKAYILFCTSVFSIILMTIVVLYAHIYVLVRKRSRKLVFHSLPHGHGTKGSEMSLALLRTVIIVLSCFITCWAPLFILMMLDVACSVRQCPILFELDWFLSLAVLNSGMNPLIYMLTGKEMRRAFLRMLPWGICSWSGSMFRRQIVGTEPSRSKSDSSPKKEEPDYSPKETVGSMENTPSYS